MRFATLGRRRAGAAGLFFFFIFCLVSRSFAQSPPAVPTPSEILVEATPLEAPAAEFARPSRTIIDEAQIRALGQPTVEALLRAVTGLDALSAGGPGQPTSVFIRGANSEDTLVLIDGLEANEAMNPSGGFDFANLEAENIEQIEILRGPQSVRYGSGAMGGVINIVTKKGTGAPTLRLFTEAGSYDTMHAAINSQGSPKGFALGNKIDYSLGVGGFQTHGFSAADANEGNSENDGGQRLSASARLDFQISDTAQVSATARWIAAQTDLDQHGGPGGDDPTYRSWSRQFLGGATATDRYFAGRLQSSLGCYYDEVARWDLSATNQDQFISENQKIRTEQSLLLSGSSTLLFDADGRWQSGESRSSGTYGGSFSQSAVSRQTESIFGEGLTYKYDDGAGFFAELGGRADQSAGFGSPLSHVALGGWRFPSKTTLSARVASGFKAPTLYQLYSQYGNSSLQQESSETYDLSAEQALGPSAKVSASVYRTYETNLISFNNATMLYYNVAAAQLTGLEFQADGEATAWLSLHAGLSFLDARDSNTGLKLLRRPDSTAVLQIRLHSGPWEASAAYRYFGMRDDADPASFGRAELPYYDLVSLSGSWQINTIWRATLRVDNLFNRQYEEIDGYGTAGLSGYAGVTAQL